MGNGLLIASNHAGDHLSRAGDHAVVLGIVALIAVVGGLVYGLVRLISKSRTRPHRERER